MLRCINYGEVKKLFGQSTTTSSGDEREAASNTTVMSILWLFTAISIPYIAPFLLLHTPSTWPSLEAFIEHYIYLLILLVLWHGALMTVELFVRHRIEKLSPRAIGSIIAVGCCTILALGLIQIVRVRFDPLFFYSVLVMIAFTSFAIVLRKRGKIALSILALLAYDTSVAYTMFMLIEPVVNWPALLFSLAIAGQVASYRIAQYYATNTSRIADILVEKTTPTSSRFLFRLYMITLISGVVFVGILISVGALHPIYFSVYAILPLIASLAEEVRSSAGTPQNIKDFIPRNTRILLFFTVIIPSVSLLFA